MDYEPRERIGQGTKFLMLFVAIALYLLELLIDLIPVVGWIFAWFIDISIWGIFWMWFRLCDASLSKNKGKNIISFLVGFIPEIGGILTAFPVVIYLNIRSIQQEDEEYNEAQEAERQAEYQARRAYIEQQQAELETEEPEPEFDEQQAANEERMARILAQEENNPEESTEVREAGRAQLPAEEDLTSDALDILNNKENKNQSDVIRLTRAAVVLHTGQLTPADRNDPVLMAAYNKHQAGIREFNPNTQRGYRFNTTNYQ